MENLLRLQALDLKIEACKKRETEIPKQKERLEAKRARLAAELEDREAACKKLEVDQRECYKDIDQLQTHLNKYQAQLNTVKKNEEYQALLHEIDSVKEQIAQKEEHILAIMMELEEAQEGIQATRERIKQELARLDEEAAAVDEELAEAQAARRELEENAKVIAGEVDETLLARYRRIQNGPKAGAAVVPLNGEVCTGCHMSLPPQLVNEVWGGQIKACNHCGRLLYRRENFESGPASQANAYS